MPFFIRFAFFSASVRRGLTNQLEEIFPPITPTPEDKIEKIVYQAGQRSVVEWIIQYMEEN
jgi:hypothetical protein